MKVWKVFLTFALLFVTSEAQTGTPTPTANSTAAPTKTPSATKTAAPTNTTIPTAAAPFPTMAMVITCITIFLILLLLVYIITHGKRQPSFSQKGEGNGLEQEMLPRTRGGNDDTEPVTDLYTFKFGDALDASKTLHDNTLNNGGQNLNAFKFGDSIEDSMSDSYPDLQDSLSKVPLKRNGSQDLSDTLQTSKTLSKSQKDPKNRRGTGVTFKLPKDIKDSTPSTPVDDYKTSRMKPPKPCLKQCDTDDL